MLTQLLIGLLLATVTLVLHAVGTIRLLMPLSGIWGRKRELPMTDIPVVRLNCLIGGLLLLNFLEAGIWAAAFAALGVIGDFESALCYSLESYTTVGYGNFDPQPNWRLLGPLEATVGLMMLGWSTAIVVAAVQRLFGNHAPS